MISFHSRFIVSFVLLVVHFIVFSCLLSHLLHIEIHIVCFLTVSRTLKRHGNKKGRRFASILSHKIVKFIDIEEETKKQNKIKNWKNFHFFVLNQKCEFAFLTFTIIVLSRQKIFLFIELIPCDFLHPPFLYVSLPTCYTLCRL